MEPILDRHRRLAKLCNGARQLKSDTLATVQSEGFVSVASKERFETVKANMKEVNRVENTWNKGDEFGQRGHLAYCSDRYAFRKQLLPTFANIDFLPEEKADRNPVLTLRCMLHQQQYKQTLLRRRNLLGHILKQEYEERTQLRERGAMLREELEVRLLYVSQTNTEEELVVLRTREHLIENFKKDLQDLKAMHLPAIHALEIKRDTEEATFDEELGKQVELELSKRLAYRAYSLVCKEYKIHEDLHIVNQLGNSNTFHLHNITISEKHLLAIVAALHCVQSLDSFWLEENSIGNPAMNIIGNLLQQPSISKTLVVLHLSRNQIQINAATALLENIRDSNAVLERLLLPHNSIYGSSKSVDVSKFGSALSSCLLQETSRLKEVDLSFNQLGGWIAIEIASILVNPLCDRLEILNLKFCNIKRRGASAIVKSLKSNQSIKSINMASTGVNDRCAEDLASCLSSIDCMIQELSISGNTDFSKKGCLAVARALKVNTSLVKLSIADCSFPVAGHIALMEALRYNYRLEILDLNFKEFIYDKVESMELEKRICMAADKIVEFAVEVVAIESYYSFTATMKARDEYHGMSVLHCQNIPDLIPISNLRGGEQCIARVNLQYCNAVVDNLFDGESLRAQVNLVDYQVEGGDPTTQEVQVDQLKYDCKDLAVLRMFYVTKNYLTGKSHKLPLECEPVLFPLHVLPSYLNTIGNSAYYQTGVVSSSYSTGPAFHYLDSSTDTHLALECSNWSSAYPNQSQFEIQWPISAISKSTTDQLTSTEDFLYFDFYETSASVTAGLRLAQRARNSN